MKKNKIIWIIIGILLIGFIIYLATRKEKPFNELTFPITNVVMNKTTQVYLPTIIYAGLHELNIDSTYIMVFPMSEKMKTNGLGDETYELLGTLIGNKTQNVLYVNKMNRSDCITVISHELIHLSQFHSGRLVKKDGINTVLWEGKIFDVTLVPYMDRPWEIEAFKRDKDLEKKIIRLLLK